MLDIDMLRPDKGGDPERFREIQRRRFKDVTLIDRILEADAAWRQQVNAVDSLNAEYNKASKEIGEKMKAKDVAGAEPLKAAQLERGKTIEEAKKQLQELDETRDRLLKSVGNFVHDSVPVHDNEDFNKVERTFWAGRPEQEHKQYRFAVVKRVFPVFIPSEFTCLYLQPRRSYRHGRHCRPRARCHCCRRPWLLLEGRWRAAQPRAHQLRHFVPR